MQVDFGLLTPLEAKVKSKTDRSREFHCEVVFSLVDFQIDKSIGDRMKYSAERVIIITDGSQRSINAGTQESVRKAA